MTDTDDLLARAGAHMTLNYPPPRLILERGEGSWVWDSDGARYLDFAGGIGVNLLGHGHPRITEAITRQAERLCHTSNMFYHRGYIELCERLSELSFGERTYLCNSGTEAIEAALKMARRLFYDRGEERTGFVATVGSFHGRTYGAISITGQPDYRAGFEPMVPGVQHVPFGDIDAMRGAVGPSTAAVIVEPIQGNGGVTVAPEGYLAGLRELCDEAGCLLVFDEVQTGVARTGRWFAHEYDGVTPDMMTLAKALGGGLPVGALLCNEAAAAPFKPGIHASTFGGNPVACAAALATLDVVASEGLLGRAVQIEQHFTRTLEPHLSPDGPLRGVRGRGALLGVETSQSSKDVLAGCRERGLLVTAAGPNVVRLFPPLVASDAEVEQAVELLTAAVA